MPDLKCDIKNKKELAEANKFMMISAVEEQAQFDEIKKNDDVKSSHIQERLQNNFAKYRKQNFFCDCELNFGTHTTFAHKIILAKYSSYFKNKFLANPSKGIYKESPSFNPSGLLEKAIDFLYESQIIFDKQNIIPYAAISEKYGIGILKDLVKEHFPFFLEKDTALEFSKQCVEYGIEDADLDLISTIAKNWNSYRISEIYEKVGPIILSRLLDHEILRNKFNQDRKIQIIDRFVAQLNRDLTPIEKERLTATVDFTADNSYQYLVRHKCKWVESTIFRRLSTELIKRRRIVFHTIKDQVESLPNSTELFSSKYALTQLINIKHSDPSADNTPLIDSISTFGGLTQGFDPSVIGTVNIDSSEPMSRDIKPNFAFGMTPGQKFVSIIKNFENPYFEIDFGKNTKAIINSIKLVCSSQEHVDAKLNKLKSQYRKPEDLIYLYANPVSISIIGTKLDGQTITLYDGLYSEIIPIECEEPITKVKFISTYENQAGFNIFRIFGIEIFGNFLPN